MAGTDTGGDTFSVTASGISTLSLSAEGSYGGLGCTSYHRGAFTMTGSSAGTMAQTEGGGWGSSTFHHNRNYTALQSVNQAGTFSGSNVSFSQYWADSFSTSTSHDDAPQYSQDYQSTSHTNITGTGSLGTQNMWSSAQSSTDNNGVVTSSSGNTTYTSSVTLTFDTDSLKPGGPLAPLAGQAGLSSMSLIDGVKLAGSFTHAPEVPLAGPAATTPSRVLGSSAGWWLELSADGGLNPERWPGVHRGAEQPEHTSLDTALHYDPAPSWAWFWPNKEAAQTPLSEAQWAHTGAWFEFVQAEPSGDPFYLSKRNPAPLSGGNPWDGDFLKAFDNALMARIRAESMGEELLPLFSGSLPLYGPGGGYQTLGQVSRDIQDTVDQVVDAIQEFLPLLQQVPGLGQVITAGMLIAHVAQGDWVNATIDVAGLFLQGKVNGVARALGVSQLSRASSRLTVD